MSARAMPAEPITAAPSSAARRARAMWNVFIYKSSDVMVVPQGGMRRSRAIWSRGSKRRRDAVQTRVRGGCSGGGWPRPSGRASFRRRVMLAEAVRNGWTTMAVMPAKHLDMQAAMKTHLSQSTGAGAFDGQHGISFAISSVVPDGDISFAMACIGTSEGFAAIT